MQHGLPGILVAIEGIDGAGKTTQVGLVTEALKECGLEVVCSKEPTNGPHGKRLRDSALSGRMTPEEELETFIADRKQHVEELILPSLAAGKVVILDRYYFSTAAYQGIRGLDWSAIIARNEEFAPRPDLLAVISVDPLTGIARVTKRDGQANHFERVDDLVRCQAIFALVSGPHVRRLDGSKPKEELRDELVHKILRIWIDRVTAGPGDYADKMARITEVLGAWPVTPPPE